MRGKGWVSTDCQLPISGCLDHGLVFAISGAFAARRTIEWEADYFPFGTERVITNSLENHFLFTGYEFDSEMGYYYANAREQSPNLGRFFSVDPDNAGADEEDPQSWNAYSYSRNNPVRYTDPDGLSYRVCQRMPNGQETNCTNITDDQFDNISHSSKDVQFKNGEVTAVNRDGSKTVIGSYQQTDVDLPGDSESNRQAAGMIGIGGQAFINAFMLESVKTGVLGGVGGVFLKGLSAGLGIAEEEGFIGYEAGALSKAAGQGLTATTTFNVGKGVLNGEVTGVSTHALLQSSARTVNASEVAEALSHVPKGPYGSVFRFYGATAQVRVNMITGKIVTIIPMTAR